MRVSAEPGDRGAYNSPSDGGLMYTWSGSEDTSWTDRVEELSRTQSATSSITSSKSKVPQVNPVIRPARDPEKQEAHAKLSGNLVSHDQISNKLSDISRVLSRDKSRDLTCFGWARSPLINQWQTVGITHNQRRHVTLVIG
jgi:hypothetical protein